MTVITIPNRPAGTDNRSIGLILADFDAITSVVNGSLDSGNLSAAAAQSAGMNQSGQTVKGSSSISGGYTIGGGNYGLASTPDQITGLVLPSPGLIRITSSFILSKSVGNGGVSASLFLGSTQIGSPQGNSNGGNLPFCEVYLFNGIAPTITSVVGTGMVMGGKTNTIAPWNVQGYPGLVPYSGDGSGGSTALTTGQVIGVPIDVYAVAGTYTVSIQYKVDAGVTGAVSNRMLYAQAISFA